MYKCITEKIPFLIYKMSNFNFSSLSIDEEIEDIEKIEVHQLLQLSDNLDDKTEFSEYLGELMSTNPEPFTLLSNLTEKYIKSKEFPKSQRNVFLESLSDQVEMMIDILGNSYSEYQLIVKSKESIFISVLINTLIRMDDFDSIGILISDELDTYDQTSENILTIPNILQEYNIFNNLIVLISIISNDNWYMYFEYINSMIEDDDQLLDHIRNYGCESICEFFDV